MSRYIDAEEVEKRIDVVIGSEPRAWDKKALKELKMYIVHAVPTADVVERSSYESMEHTVAKLNEALSNSVEVIRCKDCKHWHDNTEFCDQCRREAFIDAQLTADVRDDATAHKVVGGGERDGTTCWFECDNCGLAVDIGDVFCKHCGARFVP